ncbi:unnamed protein product, partial [Onchocerca ochengi]
MDENRLVQKEWMINLIDNVRDDVVNAIEFKQFKIFAHSYVLVAYLKTSVDQCEYMMFPWECFMIRIPASLTSNLNAASIPTLAIERAIATYFSSRYEKFGKSIAVILIIAQAVIAFGSCLYIYIDFKLLDSEKMVYCMAASNKDAPKVA